MKSEYSFVITDPNDPNVGGLDTIIVDDNNDCSIPALIYSEIINCFRSFAFEELFKDFKGSIYDIESVKSYLSQPHLPSFYKNYAHDLSALKERLVPTKTIVSYYQISDITFIRHVSDDLNVEFVNYEASTCSGCDINSAKQDDHMDCFGGCMHDQKTCISCN